MSWFEVGLACGLAMIVIGIIAELLAYVDPHDGPPDGYA